MYKQLSNFYYGSVFSLLELQEGKIFSFLGSAFICSNKGYLATCAHNINISKHDKLYIATIEHSINEFTPLTNQSVNAIKISIVQFDSNSDVCLLKINNITTNFHAPDNFLLKNRTLDVGSKCLYMGYPFGDFGFHKAKISATIISSKIINEKGVKQYVLDTMVHSGNSGGPVIDIESGYICGIISGRFNPMGKSGMFIGNYQVSSDTTISKAIPIEYLISLMNRENI